MTLTHQVATIKMTKVMSKNAEVMHAMNSLIKLPQLNAQMREMAFEMEKAGLIEEMVGDAMESALGSTDEVEAEADEEVNKVLEELTMGMFKGTAEVGHNKLPAKKVEEQVQVEEEEEAVDTQEEEAMMRRMQAL